MFNSPEHALRFAFRMRHKHVISIPSSSNIANKVDNQSTSDRLTSYDMHAQVGMIFNFLGRQPEDLQLYAFYVYGNMRERKLAANLIVKKYRGTLSKYGLDKVQLRNVLFGRSSRDSAKIAGISTNKAWKLRGELAGILSPIQDRLMDALWEWLEPNLHSA